VDRIAHPAHSRHRLGASHGVVLKPEVTQHFAMRGPVQPEAVIEIQCVRKRTGERPAPAGILALSGFVPTVDGWQASLADRTATRAFIAHGRSRGFVSTSGRGSGWAPLRHGGAGVRPESDS
jgi:hypothetical protein